MARSIASISINHSVLSVLELFKKDGQLSDSKELYRLPYAVHFTISSPKDRVFDNSSIEANPFETFFICLSSLFEVNLDWFAGTYGQSSEFIDSARACCYPHYLNYRHDLSETFERLSCDKEEDSWHAINLYQSGVDNFSCGIPFIHLPSAATQLYLSARGSYLDMSVVSREPDYVSNFLLHDSCFFSMLLEYAALRTGKVVGSLSYFADRMKAKKADVDSYSPSYRTFSYDGSRMSCDIDFGDMDSFCSDMETFLDLGPVLGLKNRFVKKVVVPMHQSYLNLLAYRRGECGISELTKSLQSIKSSDWRTAAIQYIGKVHNNGQKI